MDTVRAEREGTFVRTSHSVAVLITSICVCILSLSLNAQVMAGSSQAGLTEVPVTSDPTFEVATIKLSHPNGGDYPSINTHSRTFSATNTTVLDLIKWSYQLREEQIKNAPPWMSETKFDLVGQPDLTGQPSRDQDRLMLRKLLAERFHLIVHENQQISSVYAFERGDGPLRMVPSSPAGSPVVIKRKLLNDRTMQIEFTFATMPDFIYVLMNALPDYQIVDETGLKGEYDFTLTLPAEALEGSVEPGDVSAAFFGAIRSIGLRMDHKKASIRVIVIDHIDKPTDN